MITTRRSVRMVMLEINDGGRISDMSLRRPSSVLRFQISPHPRVN
jgi:hypothetical protein